VASLEFFNIRGLHAPSTKLLLVGHSSARTGLSCHSGNGTAGPRRVVGLSGDFLLVRLRLEAGPGEWSPTAVVSKPARQTLPHLPDDPIRTFYFSAFTLATASSMAVLVSAIACFSVMWLKVSQLSQAMMRMIRIVTMLMVGPLWWSNHTALPWLCCQIVYKMLWI